MYATADKQTIFDYLNSIAPSESRNMMAACQSIADQFGISTVYARKVWYEWDKSKKVGK